MNKYRSLLTLIACVAIAQSAGLIGSLCSVRSIEGWYTTLAKPFFNPPNWVFGPVWILLYTLMGISLFLVWQSANSARRTLWIVLFLAHLVVNASWSLVFFCAQSPGSALGVIGVLWLMILALIVLGMTASKRAALLLVPYFAWVTFAAALNAEIFRLN